jgi:hypothetical protein
MIKTNIKSKIAKSIKKAIEKGRFFEKGLAALNEGGFKTNFGINDIKGSHSKYPNENIDVKIEIEGKDLKLVSDSKIERVSIDASPHDKFLELKGPRFKFGDILLQKASLYVGRVTGVNFNLSGGFVYELNNAPGAFSEIGLIKLQTSYEVNEALSFYNIKPQNAQFNI